MAEGSAAQGTSPLTVFTRKNMVYYGGMDLRWTSDFRISLQKSIPPIFVAAQSLLGIQFKNPLRHKAFSGLPDADKFRQIPGISS